MSTVKRIVCLANARKDGERCLAGKELLPDGSSGGWIRPISDQRRSGALVEQERVYVDRTEPALLDIVNIRVSSANPESYQRENWVLTHASQCARDGQIAWTNLEPLVDSPRELWINGCDSSGRKNNRIPIEQANALDSSLFLIKVDRVRVETDRGIHGRQKKYGSFQHGVLRHNYTLEITDPAFEEKYETKVEKFSLGESYLTVSLGAEFKGYAYKLIAGVMQREEA